jgi:DNA repair exonuclease SbcCD ATPase subunit
MAEYYNEDYEKVEAFSAEEVEKKIEAEREKIAAEVGKEAEETKKQLEAKTKEYEGLSKKYDSRKTEYDNLKDKMKETGETLDKTAGERKAAFEKMRDSMITKAAGDDKEYEEKLREAYDRLGTETLDSSEMETQLKESHAIAMTHLDRDFSAFSMSTAGTGNAPTVKKAGEETFTETKSGKDTLDHVMTSMGQVAPAEEAKK